MNFKKTKHTIVLVVCLLARIQLTLADGWTRAAHNPFPTRIPDHIILTWSNDPATTQSVTWRTDTTVVESWAEISKAVPAPAYIDMAVRVQAVIESFSFKDYSANYHSVTFHELEPNTQYLYRVGATDSWSEWFSFRTAADTDLPLKFIFMGDGQTHLLSMWSNAIRTAYSAAPDARFILHAGDLVDHGRSYRFWNGWFEAAGWINSVKPVIPAIGNHEYYNYDDLPNSIPPLWQLQFTLPENGIEELPETNYYIDIQGVRIVILNSLEALDKQAEWLKKILKDNPNKWTIASFHHPVYSSARGRDEKQTRAAWKSIFEQYSVDLVLTGHDHTYARGHNVRPIKGFKEPQTGPVYVVSVSGPKLYHLTNNRWMDRAAENTQLYHIITIDNDNLHFTAYTVTGELYDEFLLQKSRQGLNIFIDKNPGTAERTFESSGIPDK